MVKIIKADGVSERKFIEELKRRAGENDAQVEKTVKQIIADVKERGDEAVREYTEKFDGAYSGKRELSKEDLKAAADRCDAAFITALQNAASNIEDFHSRQKREGFDYFDRNGNLLGQRIKGLDKVGIYVPGGTAAYPSTVLMNTIPARIAGVGEIIMITPPPKKGQQNDAILAAAHIVGVDRVIYAGGAQGIAALAFGTESIPRVDKIVGPGNIYVATAKRLLFGTVDIDMIAGPSEILIISDSSADVSYLAADMMSQAEHDVLASSIMLTTSEETAVMTDREIARQIEGLSRREIIEKSLADNGAIIICESLQKAAELANEIAPEHLEIMTDSPEFLLESVRNAGSVFLGSYSPEPLGDYYAGPNHVLPTSGTARFFSPLSVDSFIKKFSFIKYSRANLNAASEDIVTLARSEGLDAHANSITVRYNSGK